MVLNINEALGKISVLIDKLQRNEFNEEIHDEIKHLCINVKWKKSYYKAIDIHYPTEKKVKVIDYSGKNEHKLINLVDQTKLREDCLTILQKLKRFFTQRKELYS